MPIRFLLGPQGQHVEFEDAPGWFEALGIMPSYAVQAIIESAEDSKPSFNVKPSDVNPAFNCRRQRVWQATNDYGVNPLDMEAMLEGGALHKAFGSMEVDVPAQNVLDVTPEGQLPVSKPNRLDVCGVPMRGKIDWLTPDRIEDLKTTTPFWIARFATKEQKLKDPTARPWAEIWEPKDDTKDIENWQLQLSIYAILLAKSGKHAPTEGRIWRRYGGVKADKPRWKRFDFALLSEDELDARVGDWIRGLWEGLQASQSDDHAWKGVPADGREFIGSRGNLWACDRCALRDLCFKQDGLEVF